MTNLSPAAQAVLSAWAKPVAVDRSLVISGRALEHQARSALAAALRAAADQVVPDGPKPSANSDFHLMNWTKFLDQYYQRQQTRAELLAIAAELENTND
jgi:hypothetical protein